MLTLHYLVWGVWMVLSRQTEILFLVCIADSFHVLLFELK